MLAPLNPGGNFNFTISGECRPPPRLANFNFHRSPGRPQVQLWSVLLTQWLLAVVRSALAILCFFLVTVEAVTVYAVCMGPLLLRVELLMLLLLRVVRSVLLLRVVLLMFLLRVEGVDRRACG